MVCLIERFGFRCWGWQGCFLSYSFLNPTWSIFHVNLWNTQVRISQNANSATVSILHHHIMYIYIYYISIYHMGAPSATRPAALWFSSPKASALRAWRRTWRAGRPGAQGFGMGLVSILFRRVWEGRVFFFFFWGGVKPVPMAKMMKEQSSGLGGSQKPANAFEGILRTSEGHWHLWPDGCKESFMI